MPTVGFHGWVGACKRRAGGLLRSGPKHLLLALLLAPALASAAPVLATVTLLDGGATLLRGTARYVLAEGVRLDAGDVIELTEKALLQAEFNDGTLVALGPQTRLMLMSWPTQGARGTGELFLLNGWLKMERARGQARVAARLSTPLIEIDAEDATLVVHTSADETSVFAESGEARLAHLKRPGATSEESRLKPSQFYTCKAGQRGLITARPAHVFVTGMPRSFMDTLPPRIARFKERSVTPKRSGEFSYEDVEDWINSVPPVRRAVVHRWHAKAAEPAFRRALLADLKDHPEWDRILNPEKYKDTTGSPGAEPAAEPK